MMLRLLPALFLGLLLSPAPAYGQGSADVRQQLGQGWTFLEAGNLRKAEDAFSAAFEDPVGRSTAEVYYAIAAVWWERRNAMAAYMWLADAGKARKDSYTWDGGPGGEWDQRIDARRRYVESNFTVIKLRAPKRGKPLPPLADPIPLDPLLREFTDRLPTVVEEGVEARVAVQWVLLPNGTFWIGEELVDLSGGQLDPTKASSWELPPDRGRARAAYTERAAALEAGRSMAGEAGEAAALAAADRLAEEERLRNEEAARQAQADADREAALEQQARELAAEREREEASRREETRRAEAERAERERQREDDRVAEARRMEEERRAEGRRAEEQAAEEARRLEEERVAEQERADREREAQQRRGEEERARAEAVAAAEQERRAEAERAAEQERRAAAERAAEQERRAEAERERRAEAAAEQERGAKAERERRAEELRTAERERRAEELRSAERERREAEAKADEDRRLAEERRLEESRAADARRLEEERLEESALAADARREEERLEEASLAADARREEERKAADAGTAEERRRARERADEEARLAEARRREEERERAQAEEERREDERWAAAARDTEAAEARREAAARTAQARREAGAAGGDAAAELRGRRVYLALGGGLSTVDRLDVDGTSVEADWSAHGEAGLLIPLNEGPQLVSLAVGLSYGSLPVAGCSQAQTRAHAVALHLAPRLAVPIKGRTWLQGRVGVHLGAASTFPTDGERQGCATARTSAGGEPAYGVRLVGADSSSILSYGDLGWGGHGLVFGPDFELGILGAPGAAPVFLGAAFFLRHDQVFAAIDAGDYHFLSGDASGVELETVELSALDPAASMPRLQLGARATVLF